MNKANTRNYAEILGRNVTDRLDSLKKTTAWLARESGVDAPGIARIQRAEINATVGTISKIATALGCLPADLLSDADPKQPATKEVTAAEILKFQELYLAAPEATRQLAMRTLEFRSDSIGNDYDVQPMELTPETVRYLQGLVEEHLGTLSRRANQTKQPRQLKSNKGS